GHVLRELQVLVGLRVRREPDLVALGSQWPDERGRWRGQRGSRRRGRRHEDRRARQGQRRRRRELADRRRGIGLREVLGQQLQDLALALVCGLGKQALVV